MQQYLMHFCMNWGERDCHPDVAGIKYGKQLKGGEDIPTWPVGEEQEKLDKICKECRRLVLKIERKKCPKCGSERILPGHLLTGWKANSIKGYVYRCENCDAVLNSIKKLL